MPAAVKAFDAAYGAKFPKAVAKVVDDLDVLLAFYDFPAEHWVHLRTTNPIESTFATVRHRTKVTRGPGSRTAGLAMAFKLIGRAGSLAGGERPSPGGARPGWRHVLGVLGHLVGGRRLVGGSPPSALWRRRVL